jgi:hypothetical protein
MQLSDDVKDSDFYRAFERKRYGLQTCFLCSRRLTKKNRSDEHVFPKWLQERFGLWDQQLVLLNGSSIPYRQLVIPCCAECNNEDLSQLENTVRIAVEKGVEAVRDLPLLTLFQWTGKIYYGLLYKEYFLRRNRADGSKATIVTRDVLERFKLHHFFLQSIKRPIEFHGAFPASRFVHRLQSPKDVRRQFNFRDLHHFLGLSIQLGGVGMIAVLQDGGVQADILGDTHRGYYELELHPLQFAEMTARTFYKATLMNRTPKFTIGEGNERITVIQLPLMGFSARPVYDEWSDAHYAWVLSEHTRYPRDVISPAPGQVVTWLRNDRGDFLYLDVERDAWP